MAALASLMPSVFGVFTLPFWVLPALVGASAHDSVVEPLGLFGASLPEDGRLADLSGLYRSAGTLITLLAYHEAYEDASSCVDIHSRPRCLGIHRRGPFLRLPAWIRHTNSAQLSSLSTHSEFRRPVTQVPRPNARPRYVECPSSGERRMVPPGAGYRCEEGHPVLAGTLPVRRLTRRNFRVARDLLAIWQMRSIPCGSITLPDAQCTASPEQLRQFSRTMRSNTWRSR